MESPVRIETKLTTDVDVLWIAVKAYQLIGALRAVPPESKIGTIIPLLTHAEQVNMIDSIRPIQGARATPSRQKFPACLCR
jgi:hypothetical protein